MLWQAAPVQRGRMKDLTRLPPHGEDGEVHVVVEAPRGCAIKLRYEPKLGTFLYGRALPVGLTYPYDWGFVPGTRAADGDPLDALVVGDAPTYPGVVVPCRLLGVVLLDEKDEQGKRERNDRLVAIPLTAERFDELDDPDSLPKRLREEIEQFFLSTTFFTPKHARCLGWKGPKHAARLLRAAIRGK